MASLLTVLVSEVYCKPAHEPQPSAHAMAARAYFLAVFAPEGWPSSVAPEYGRYQLWDTIQQVRAGPPCKL